MIKLIFLDLKAHTSIWIGAFLVALTGGYLGGWAVSLMATASFYTGDLFKTLQNAGSSMVVFSCIAGIGVLISAGSLTIALQQRSYALWSLANVQPKMITLIVLIQLAVVGFLGAFVGSMVAAASFIPLFPLVFVSIPELAPVVPHVSISSLSSVWWGVALVFVCGGYRGARCAGKTPALLILREPEPRFIKVTWPRLVLFVVLVVCLGLIVYAMNTSSINIVMSWSMFVPLMVAAALVPIAPVLFRVLLVAWTQLLPQSIHAWYLARQSARYGLSLSTAVETPLMVGVSLVAGVFSSVSVVALYMSETVGSKAVNGLGVSQALILLGGPILLCAVGAAVSVVMSSRTRMSDVALLMASGAQPSTLLRAAFCEALIHTVTAGIIGVLGVVVSNIIITHAFGLAPLRGLVFGEGAFVLVVGFLLVCAATCIPTWRALTKDIAPALSIRE